ncbi:trypsin-like peptidase domain-containing protein [Naasia sp. SYSU D00057]|uniref:trypsin-like peptidase domain-containing protein n=1 Tax=Naasia sp. SYSU D00057 TaxID=2817380 RepID=UPI001B30C4D6|nr:trypsin-like peptidase domain-containing protein [Naasia sp. SYSU D00057]
MTDNPQTPQGQPGDPAAGQRTGATDSAPTERLPETAASPETPTTSPTGSGSPAEQQPPQAPGIAPSAAAPAAPAAGHSAPPPAADPGAAFGPAPSAQHPASEQPTAQYAQHPADEHAAQPAESKPAKRRIALPLIGALAVGALIGGGSGAGIYALASGGNDGTQTVSTSTAPNVVVNRSEDATTVTAVAAKASPSVVTIAVSGNESAGIVLSEDGYVLTNTHVVTLDGATGSAQVEVTMSDGRIFNATIVGTDPVVDLAVIKLEGASDLTPIDFADSDDLNVGDSAIAIGAPLGLSGTVTDGIISALNRSITVASSAVPESQGEDTDQGDSGDGSQSPFDFWNFDIPGDNGSSATPSSSISLPVIQTDASINPGNSGGALLNAQGELIGVNVAIASAGSTSGGQSGSIGVGFAIPSNLAQRVADEIIENGEASHGLLGATVADAGSQDPDAQLAGAYISDVVPGGAAEQAGLRSGDIITEFNGKAVTSQTDLTAQVRYLAGGSTAELTYVRNGDSNQVSVTLGTLDL